MRKLLLTLAALVIVIIALLLIAPSFIPISAYRDQITAGVKNATGRDLAINGELSLSLFPSLAVSATDVTFANAPGLEPANMATMDAMRVSVAVLPLLSRRVEVSSFTLERPVIHLTIDRRGKPNWQFDAPQSASASPQSGAASESESASGSAENGGFTMSEISLDDIRLVDGEVHFRNLQSGQAYDLTAVNAELELPSLDEPLALAGSAVLNDRELELAAAVEAPRALMDGESSPGSFGLKTDFLEAAFEGSFKAIGGFKLDGTADVSSSSVRELAAWAGNPLPAGGGFGPLDISGALSADQQIATFRDAKIAFDGMNGSGKFAINYGGQKPGLLGELALDKLDVNPYLGGGTSAGNGGGGGGGGGGSSAGSAKGGWSRAPIDLSGLNAINMAFDILADEVFFQDLHFNKSQVNLNVTNGVLKATLKELDLYDGGGNGQLTVNAAGATPVIRSNFTLADVAALPLLTDAMGLERLKGIAAMNFNVQTQGNSQHQWMQNLNGKGKLQFRDGALVGINIAQLLRTVGSGGLTGWGAGGAKDTDFSELGGTFTIKNGVLQNNDLAMLSPLLRVAGKGKVNIVEQTLNYRIDPKVVGSLEGQGGAADIGGFDVPVLITGSWSDPKFLPDIGGALTKPGGLIESLTGGGKKDAPTEEPASGDAPAKKEKPQPEDLLRNLLNR